MEGEGTQTTGTSEDRKRNKERGKRMQKRKLKKSQKKNVEKIVAPPPVKIATFSSKDSSTRSYDNELLEYLTSWEKKDIPGHAWKFSKVIQSWALENCFQKDKIDTNLFKRLLPYVETVQGAARDRLLASADSIIEKCESGEDVVDDEEENQPADNDPENEGNNGNSYKTRLSKKMLKRARKVRSILVGLE